MDKFFRRLFFTALVAGGLAVVAASSAYAAGDGQSDPVTQGASDRIEGAAPAGGAVDAAVEDHVGKGVDATAGDGSVAAESVGGHALEREATGDVLTEDVPNEGASSGHIADEDGAHGAAGLVDGVVGRRGFVGSLVRGDLVGLVDGALGKDGLVSGLLEGVLASDTDAPGPDEPGTDEPGAGEPGTGEPGEPGSDEPGEPGTDAPGSDGPGTVDPGAGDPGVVDPGTGGQGTDDPDGDGPGTGPGAGSPGTDRPRGGPGTRDPGGEAPGAAIPAYPGTDGYGYGFGTPGDDAGSGADAADAGASLTRSDVDRDLPRGGVDISWGDDATVVPTAYGGAILPGGLGDGLGSTLTELDGQAVPVVDPGETLARTGSMITGQLALVSLLLGLGTAALRMRRRRLVV